MITKPKQTNLKSTSNSTILISGCLMAIIAQTGISLYLPSFLAIGQSFHTGKSNIVLSLTLYLVGYAVSILLWGPLSDYIGRKKTLVLTLILFGVPSILIAFTSSLPFFLICRLLQGTGGGGSVVIGRAAIRDYSVGPAALVKGMSYVSMAFIISLSISQLIGGQFEKFLNWRYEFIFSALLALISLIYLIRKLPFEKRDIPIKKMNITSIVKQYINLATDKKFLYPTIVGGFGYSIIIVFNAVGPFLFQHTLHFTPQNYGYLGILVTAGYLIGMFITVKLVARITISHLIKYGLTIIVVSGIFMVLGLLVIGINPYVIMIPFTLSVVGQAMIFPNAMAIALQPFKNVAGSATALFGFIQQIIASGMAYFSSFLPHNTQLSIAIIIILVGLVGLLFLRKMIQLELM